MAPTHCTLAQLPLCRTTGRCQSLCQRSPQRLGRWVSPGIGKHGRRLPCSTYTHLICLLYRSRRQVAVALPTHRWVGEQGWVHGAGQRGVLCVAHTARGRPARTAQVLPGSARASCRSQASTGYMTEALLSAGPTPRHWRRSGADQRTAAAWLRPPPARCAATPPPQGEHVV
jgi:hypothetical protein